MNDAAVWRLFDSGPQPAIDNMAWDEALLSLAAGSGYPLLRLYGWREPAATFGYFQKWREVEKLTPLRPLLRRPTGGGLVPHAADWTYSVVIPPADPWYALSAVDSYRHVHEWVRSAFLRLGADAELAAQSRQDSPGQCFAGAERFDVLSNQRKIAGAAQRRNRDGLLIQGSIQPPAGIDRRRFEEAFLQEAAERWGIQWVRYWPEPALTQKMQTLREQKYAQPEYHTKR